MKHQKYSANQHLPTMIKTEWIRFSYPKKTEPVSYNRKCGYDNKTSATCYLLSKPLRTGYNFTCLNKKKRPSNPAQRRSTAEQMTWLPNPLGGKVGVICYMSPFTVTYRCGWGFEGGVCSVPPFRCFSAAVTRSSTCLKFPVATSHSWEIGRERREGILFGFLNLIYRHLKLFWNSLFLIIK